VFFPALSVMLVLPYFVRLVLLSRFADCLVVATPWRAAPRGPPRTNTMKARQINSGFGQQCRQTGNKTQRLKDGMTAPVTGGAVTVGCFEWVAHLGVSRYCQPFF
jgi:hypothetical protein